MLGQEPQITRCKIDQAGRLLIPADIRHSLRIAAGDELILEVNHGRLTFSTFQDVLKETQDFLAKFAIPGQSIVDELIGERRAEAAGE